MLRNMWSLSLTTALTSLALVACGDDKNMTDESTSSVTTTGDDTSAGTSNPTSTDPSTTMGETSVGTTEPDTTSPTTDAESSTGPVGETAANGEACMSNGDCMSLACEKYRDLEMGTCVAGPDGGNTRVMGTLVDFITLATIADSEVRVLEALDALTDPVGNAPVITGTSDAGGQVDVVTTEPLKAAFGVVGIVQGPSYYPTATGLAAPLSGTTYGPMNGNRDMWAVPSAKLTEWSTLLMGDPDFMPADPADAVLPLGENGGVVGFVRDSVTGMGVAGQVIVGAGGPTGATIRYLSEDGMSFTSDMTSSSGLFVLVNPGLAEEFAVEGTAATGSAGSAKNAIFVLIMTVPG